jgi:ketosteroid isomerase-like protein
MEKPDLKDHASQSGSSASVFSTFMSAAVGGDLAVADTLLADNIEVVVMPTGQIIEGKAEVISFLKIAKDFDHETFTINDFAAKDWGVFEYWNTGVVTDEFVAFGNEQKWPWPQEPNGLLGRKFKVVQCMVWQLNEEGKIHSMREYLDTGSLWAQFK